MEIEDLLKESMTKEEFYEEVKYRWKVINKNGSPLKTKAAYISASLPEVKSKVIEDANLALEGMLIFPGTGARPYFVGNPPKWHHNPVNDSEYVWQLSRMPHWKTLLEAYYLTNQSCYIMKVIEEFLDWIDNCPRPALVHDLDQAYINFNSVNPWRSLEAGIRTHESWAFFIDYVMDTEYMTPGLLEKFAISVYQHGEVLAQICPMFFPEANTNHYIMEMLGLLWIACNFPEFKKAEEWRVLAVKELERCCHVQMTDDGGHIEGCPMYHNGCVKWFATAMRIAAKFDIQFSEAYQSRLRKSIDYSIYSFRPSGTLVPWGDSKANKGAVMGALFGYLTFGELKWFALLSHFLSKEEIFNECMTYIAYIDNVEQLVNALNQLNNVEKNNDLLLMNWQKELNQVMMRTDWSKKALSIFFACNTPIKSSHAHLDLMGFDFTAYGRPLIVDPGVYTYRNEYNRYMFKSASWHNSLTINHEDPYEYIASFKYGPQKPGYIKSAQNENNADFMYVLAEHFNYDPAIHKRALVMVDQKIIVVLDEVTSLDEKDTVQLYYHLDAKKAVLDKKNLKVYTMNNGVDVVVFHSSNLEGQLLTGKISDKIDCMRDSIRISLEDKVSQSSNRLYASLLIPYKKDESQPAVKDLSFTYEDDRKLCSFNLNDKVYQLEWLKEEIKKR